MNGYFTYDRKVEKLDRERVRRANVALWQTKVRALEVVNPTDGGALSTPDEDRKRSRRQN